MEHLHGMTPQYPYIKRIPIPGVPPRGRKPYMTMAEVEDMLDGTVLVEEKVDGKISLVEKTHLRSVTGERDYNLTLVLENLHYIHTIFYKNLPVSSLPYHIGLDIIDEDGKLLPYDEKVDWFSRWSIPMVHRIYYGSGLNLGRLVDMMHFTSYYAASWGQSVSTQEGIVVKNYEKGIFGKMIGLEFDNAIDACGHWADKDRVSNWIQGEHHRNIAKDMVRLS